MHKRFDDNNLHFAWALLLIVVCAPVFTGSGCGRPGEAHTIPGTDIASRSEPKRFLFSEVASDTGLAFTHVSGRSDEYYMIEIYGAGAALFDFDNDGDLDVYFVQAHEWIGPKDRRIPKKPIPGDRLFRNDLPAGAKQDQLRFTDVTESSRIRSVGHGMGVAAGDFNNDGNTDLYVTNFGENQLLQNNGDGSFTNVTEQAGVSDPRWSTSTAFMDFDRDGWLDLYVCNYVDFTFATHKTCYDANHAPDYCGPLSYSPVPDRLFRNRGDGTFEDVTVSSRVATAYGAALGIVCADLDNNGWIDIYVANDGMPNQCWMNQGDGTFRDIAIISGCALNQEGVAEASMGVDAADYDNDGDEDLFMTHLADETNTIYINDGDLGFRDASAASKLGRPSHAYTGFGTSWVDYDNNGSLDIITVNGAVMRPLLGVSTSRFPPGQPNQLFRNCGDGTFEDIGDSVHPDFVIEELSRGAAMGDIDNDGDIDVLVMTQHGPARLFLNEVGQQNHWLGFRLVGRDEKRDMLGAVAEVIRGNGDVLSRRVRADSSISVARDPRVLFGLGQDPEVRSVRVRWPSDRVEQWPLRSVNSYITLRETTGTEVKE